MKRVSLDTCILRGASDELSDCHKACKSLVEQEYLLPSIVCEELNGIKFRYNIYRSNLLKKTIKLIKLTEFTTNILDGIPNENDSAAVEKIIAYEAAEMKIKTTANPEQMAQLRFRIAQRLRSIHSNLLSFGEISSERVFPFGGFAQDKTFKKLKKIYSVDKMTEFDNDLKIIVSTLAYGHANHTDIELYSLDDFIVSRNKKQIYEEFKKHIYGKCEEIKFDILKPT